eukprot:4324719-Pleurochrysis_carterae.AAC.1
MCSQQKQERFTRARRLTTGEQKRCGSMANEGSIRTRQEYRAMLPVLLPFNACFLALQCMHRCRAVASEERGNRRAGATTLLRGGIKQTAQGAAAGVCAAAGAHLRRSSPINISSD